MRFHGALTSLSEPLLDRLLDLEDGQREAVVALQGDDIVGVARFVRDLPAADTAEMAVLVADEWQHHGVGHRMLEPLIASALAAGINRFRGDMLATNAAARTFLLGLGSLVAQEYVEGHVVLTIALEA
jgi:N-acetylglutamate synthase-like GNAT family acetyltransferase